MSGASPPGYTAPVERRTPIGFATVALVGAFAIVAATSSDPGVVLLFVTLAAGGLFAAVAVVLFMPTRIEVGDDTIRLVARRTTTTYAPGDVAVHRRRLGHYALIRRQTGRTIAVFGDPEEHRVVNAFDAVGTPVVI